MGTTIGKEIIALTRTIGKGLLATKPVKVTLSDLKYTSKLKTDTFVKKVETWFDPVGHVAPYAQRGRTEVVGHHDFNAWNSNDTIEEVMRTITIFCCTKFKLNKIKLPVNIFKWLSFGNNPTILSAIYSYIELSSGIKSKNK